MNGVKTGYTLDAGNVLVGSGTRKGVTLLSVVMGAPNRDGARRGHACRCCATASRSTVRRDARAERGEAGGARGARPRRDAAPGRGPFGAGDSPARPVRSGGGSTLRARSRGRSRAAAASGPPSSPWTARWRGASPLLSKRAALAPASPSLVSRVDDAVPGPRAVAWVAAGGAAVAIVIGIALALAHRRRDQGQPGQAGATVILTVTLNAAIDRTVAVPNFRLGHRHQRGRVAHLRGRQGRQRGARPEAARPPRDRHRARRRGHRLPHPRAARRGVDPPRLHPHRGGVPDQPRGDRSHLRRADRNQRARPRGARRGGRLVHREAPLPGPGGEPVRARRAASRPASIPPSTRA